MRIQINTYLTSVSAGPLEGEVQWWLYLQALLEGKSSDGCTSRPTWRGSPVMAVPPDPLGGGSPVMAVPPGPLGGGSPVMIVPPGPLGGEVQWWLYLQTHLEGKSSDGCTSRPSWGGSPVMAVPPGPLGGEVQWWLYLQTLLEGKSSDGCTSRPTWRGKSSDGCTSRPTWRGKSSDDCTSRPTWRGSPVMAVPPGPLEGEVQWWLYLQALLEGKSSGWYCNFHHLRCQNPRKKIHT